MNFRNTTLLSVKTLTIASLLAMLPPTLLTAKVEEQAKAESMTAYMIKQLNVREQDAYDRYEKATTQEDIERIKADLQLVVDGYERLIGDSPNYSPAFVSYGMMLHRIGERNASAAVLMQADQIDSGIAIVKNQLGNYQAEDGHYNDALGFYILARDLEPSEPLYPFQIGNLLVGYRNLFIDDKTYTIETMDTMIQDSFRQSAILDPGNKQYRLRYAQSFFDIERPRWDLALDEWHKMLNLAEDDFETQMFTLYTARVRYHLKHVNAAKKLLNKIDHPNLQDSKRKLLEEIDLFPL